MIAAKYTSEALEKANIFHPGIAAYQKDKGFQTLIGVELSFREDCVESGVPACQINEDEEKFFDRICLE